MTNVRINEEFNRLIDQGAHVLIIQDASVTTVQPLTRRGHDVLYSVFSDGGLEAEKLRALSRKRNGHYLTAVKVETKPETVAACLVIDYGLPDGSVAIGRVGFDIAPVGINDRIQ